MAPPNSPSLTHDPSAFRSELERVRSRGARVALVPTMGALHAGHLALVDEGRRQVGADGVVAVTIFVNPLQFGPKEDFARYPRTLDDDVAGCRAHGVDVVFAPSPSAMYPTAFATTVRVTGITDVLEGVHRPGHFDGVTTVVAKLLGLAGPCVAVFGRKDYQQWRVIERMTRDLDLPVEIVGHPIVREADGLALSSRNRYLAPADRARALASSRGLRAAGTAFARGERDADTLRSLVETEVAASFDRIDYVAIADPETLAPLSSGGHDRAVILVAAHLGSTRLIDNLELGPLTASPS